MKRFGAKTLGSVVVALPAIASIVSCSTGADQPKVGKIAAAISNLDVGYIGCFTDEENRALPTFLGSGYTPGNCAVEAWNRGFRYAGLQWYGECWAGNSIGYSQVGDEECNTPCTYGDWLWCGGGWRNSIYDAAAVYGAGQPPEEPTEEPTVEGSTHLGEKSGYTSNGCWVESGEKIGAGMCTWCGCTLKPDKCSCALQ